ncbi:hypothetical protein N7G274_001452 [Stereocaulon virgatum]|uniref:Uncharacterized protein n=1 Tax=Stereocaulon virgatum TaxID=373712 RepID=A0ABR4ALC5_9LECA
MVKEARIILHTTCKTGHSKTIVLHSSDGNSPLALGAPKFVVTNVSYRQSRKHECYKGKARYFRIDLLRTKICPSLGCQDPLGKSKPRTIEATSYANLGTLMNQRHCVQIWMGISR